MVDPVFQHGSFRLYLLQSLADGPRHGYDIIASLDEQFGGSYRPSPGTVYPRLERLLREGLLSVRREGRKRIYALTEAGRAELARHAEDLDSLNDQVNDSVQRLAMDVRARVNESLSALRVEVAAAQQATRPGTPPPPGGSPGRGTADETPAGSSVHPDIGGSQIELRNELILLARTFASQVRADAYTAAARGELTPEAVTDLRNRLNGFSLRNRRRTKSR